MLKKLTRLAATVAVTLAVLPSPAQAWEYSFGTWLGDGPVSQPADTFAHLSVTTADSQSFNFTLSAFNSTGPGSLASAFGSGAFISKALFNSVSGENPLSITNIQTNGYIGNVVLGAGDVNLAGITFDFGDCFSGASNCNFTNSRLESGEWISWTLNFANAQQPFLGVPPVALRVEGFDHGGVTSGWYTPTTAVPEPETYAMLLAGLGLMGFLARRRRQNLAA